MAKTTRWQRNLLNTTCRSHYSEAKTFKVLFFPPAEWKDAFKMIVCLSFNTQRKRFLHQQNQAVHLQQDCWTMQRGSHPRSAPLQHRSPGTAMSQITQVRCSIHILIHGHLPAAFYGGLHMRAEFEAANCHCQFKTLAYVLVLAGAFWTINSGKSTQVASKYFLWCHNIMLLYWKKK